MNYVGFVTKKKYDHSSRCITSLCAFLIFCSRIAKKTSTHWHAQTPGQHTTPHLYQEYGAREYNITHKKPMFWRCVKKKKIFQKKSHVTFFMFSLFSRIFAVFCCFLCFFAYFHVKTKWKNENNSSTINRIVMKHVGIDFWHHFGSRNGRWTVFFGKMWF